MATVNEIRDWADQLIQEGHGDLDAVVGFDDVPDYVNTLHLGGVTTVREFVEGDDLRGKWTGRKQVVSTWYANDGSYELHDEDNA
jgi:hypothetical protein